MSANLKTQQCPQNWKRSVLIPIPKKGNAKECSNYRTIALISHTSKVKLKILQARLQQYVNHELPDVPAGFTGEGLGAPARGVWGHISHEVMGPPQARMLEWIAVSFSNA